MLYEDCFEYFDAMRSKASGKKTSCNFEIRGSEAEAMIAYGTANFVGDWAYREIDGGVSYCIYVNDPGDRLLLLLGFSEHAHCKHGINDGTRWINP